MKEFMLLIHNEGDGKETLSPEEQKKFLKACEAYIEDLQKNGNLKKAQPLAREGKRISGSPGQFKDRPYNEGGDIIVGYYHIVAGTLDEAVSIAQRNPEFAFVNGASIEVRPVKLVEKTTGFVYPGGN